MSRKKSTKIIALPAGEGRVLRGESEQLSLERCRAILCREGATYSDEEVKLVRRLLYVFAELNYNNHCKAESQAPPATPAKIIPLNNTKADDLPSEQKSDFVLPRKYRRTG